MAATKSTIPNAYGKLTLTRPHGIIERATGIAARAIAGVTARLSAATASDEQRLVAQIRQLRTEMRLEDWSDRQLNDAIQYQKLENARFPAGSLNPDTTAKVFAIVDECIRRRLGLWQIVSQEMNGIPSEQPNSHDEDYWTDIKSALEPSDRAPLMPASFYLEIRGLDHAGQYTFIPTDEQLLAGLHLLKNRVVEMQAGEGKTVTIAFAAVMNAVLGRRVHIITANDYLAHRDSNLLAPVYRSLGFSVGAILEPMDSLERRAAYECDIVYGSLREFGFDFLRDNLGTRPEDRVQSDLVSAIVDEADQALIDEADTPLIISGAGASSPHSWRRVNRAVAEVVSLQQEMDREYVQRLNETPPDSREFANLLCLATLAAPRNAEIRQLALRYPTQLRRGMAAVFADGPDSPDESLTSDLLYLVDAERNYVTVTDRGLAFLESKLGSFGPSHNGSTSAGNPVLSRKEARKLDLASQVYQSLRAHLLLQSGVDYLVEGDGVTLLDAGTGRLKPDNLYQEGLQSALEAKEGVPINPESEPLAQISVQGLASRYRFLAGITGTALAAGEEFRRRFSLATVSVPTSQTSQRVDLPARIYETDSDRMDAIMAEVSQCHRPGRPVLVGVQTIQQSLLVSSALDAAGIKHRTLNATTGHAEADIIRQAGNFGAVTVATNMAGRGTDIVLDANLSQLVIDRCLNLVRQSLDSGKASVAIRCNTTAEQEVIESALTDSPDLQVRRRQRHDLLVAKQENPFPTAREAKTEPAIHFGLGLHVISAEFTRFPRVSLQLQGRSGRQGHFGSTRHVLSWEDRGLLPLGRGNSDLQSCRKTDPNGRVYFEGKPIERYIRERQEAAELESAHRRSIAADYAAACDAHADAYYQMRRQVLENSIEPDSLPNLALAAATRIVEWHFPQLDLVEYTDQFDVLAHAAWESYEIDANHLRGVALDQLPTELTGLIHHAITDRRNALGDNAFGQLARQLLLETGDETWRSHQRLLRHTVFGSAAGNHGHKSSVADYIIQASEAWREFPGRVNDAFLSGLLTFPLDKLKPEPASHPVETKFDREIENLLQFTETPGQRVVVPILPTTENLQETTAGMTAKE